jgi:hypothetical protein
MIHGSRSPVPRNTRTPKGPVPAARLNANDKPPAPRWVRGKVAAPYIGTTEEVLARWRHLNKGPSYFVPPGIRSVLYDLNELDRWVASGHVQTSAGAA